MVVLTTTADLGYQHLDYEVKWPSEYKTYSLNFFEAFKR